MNPSIYCHFSKFSTQLPHEWVSYFRGKLFNYNVVMSVLALLIWSRHKENATKLQMAKTQLNSFVTLIITCKDVCEGCEWAVKMSILTLVYFFYSVFFRQRTSPTSNRSTPLATLPPSSLWYQLFLSSPCSGNIVRLSFNKNNNSIMSASVPERRCVQWQDWKKEVTKLNSANH